MTSHGYTHFIIIIFHIQFAEGYYYQDTQNQQLAQEPILSVMEREL